MPLSIGFDPSTAGPERTELRPSGANGVRLLNRLSGIRNPNGAGEVAPAGSSAMEEPRPAVVKAHPPASSGDMLESLPDQATARKEQEEEKKLQLDMIRSRLELQFRSDMLKARSAYDNETPRRPQLDIRV